MGVVTLVAVALAALVAVVPVVDGRSFGGFLASRIVCAVRESACPQAGEAVALRRAYGARDARLVRRLAPGVVYEPGEREVPVDFRRCRRVACARTPDDRDLDVHRTDAGRAVTMFTRVVHRGGSTYVQYWFYYPDSNTTWMGSDRIWHGVTRELLGHRRHMPGYPGFHADDWEGYEVKVGPDGRPLARATSHGGLQWCKWRECRGRFGVDTGWTRVSRGSHSGHIPLERDTTVHIGVHFAGGGGPPGLRARRERRYRRQVPGVNLHERTSTADGVRLVPLETLPKRGYRRRGKDVSPPWEKRLYRDPAGGTS